jgi:hypothetical protein
MAIIIARSSDWIYSEPTVSDTRETLENPYHRQGTHGAAGVFRRQKRRNLGFPEIH